MSWFRKPYDIKALARGSDAEAMRADLIGRSLNTREKYEPWRIPMDYAAAAGNATLARVLLECGAGIWGSSILEAIKIDSAEVLICFHSHDPKFYQRFSHEPGNLSNPMLNRWLSTFTALDYAVSIGAEASIAFMTELGARRHPTTKPHWEKCTGILIEDEFFIKLNGINIDGLSQVTTGFYCAKCERFLR